MSETLQQPMFTISSQFNPEKNESFFRLNYIISSIILLFELEEQEFFSALLFCSGNVDLNLVVLFNWLILSRGLVVDKRLLVVLQLHQSILLYLMLLQKFYGFNNFVQPVNGNGSVPSRTSVRSIKQVIKKVPVMLYMFVSVHYKINNYCVTVSISIFMIPK